MNQIHRPINRKAHGKSRPYGLDIPDSLMYSAHFQVYSMKSRTPARIYINTLYYTYLKLKDQHAPPPLKKSHGYPHATNGTYKKG